MKTTATVATFLVVALAATWMAGCGRNAAFDKAQAAADAGSINFFGFYTGMPKSDAAALATRYALQDARYSENPETHEIYWLGFSLKDVRQITKGPSTLHELAQTVANQVGDLQPAGPDAWKYETIDGVTLKIDKSGVEIRDEPRAKEAKEATVREAQREWERVQAEIAASNAKRRAGEKRKPGETMTITLPGGATMEMVWCPPGAFLRGTPGDCYQVTLTKGFWMAKTEVTQELWTSVMRKNPSNFKGDNRPVECVSWNDCQKFCQKCRNAGIDLRLPTEAEWEYACRAGSTGDYAGTGRLEDMGWYRDNSGGKTHPVGMKKANAWGLYDMHGNVWEWCADWYGGYPNGPVTNPKGASSGSNRVERGGSWNCSADYCRSAFRDSNLPSLTISNLGFRPAMDLSAE